MFIIVNGKLDIIGLKCSMLCSENIFLMMLSGLDSSYGQENYLSVKSTLYVFMDLFLVLDSVSEFVFSSQDKGSS